MSLAAGQKAICPQSSIDLIESLLICAFFVLGRVLPLCRETGLIFSLSGSVA